MGILEALCAGQGQGGGLGVRGRPVGDPLPGAEVAWEEIAERPQAARAEPAHKVTKPYAGTPPTANHPWKQRYEGMKV